MEITSARDNVFYSIDISAPGAPTKYDSQGRVLMFRGISDYGYSDLNNQPYPNAEALFRENDLDQGFGQWWDPNDVVPKFYAGSDPGWGPNAPASGIVISAWFDPSVFNEYVESGDEGYHCAPGVQVQVEQVEVYKGSGQWVPLSFSPGWTIRT